MGYRGGMTQWDSGLQDYVRPSDANERHEDTFDPGMVGSKPVTPTQGQEPQPAPVEAMFIVPELESPTKAIKRSSETLSYVENQAALDVMQPGDECRLGFAITGMRGSYIVRRVS